VLTYLKERERVTLREDKAAEHAGTGLNFTITAAYTTEFDMLHTV